MAHTADWPFPRTRVKTPDGRGVTLATYWHSPENCYVTEYTYDGDLVPSAVDVHHTKKPHPMELAQVHAQLAIETQRGPQGG